MLYSRSLLIICFIYLRFIYVFYFWLCWLFIAVRGLSLVVASRGYSLFPCEGFSSWWHLLLPSMGLRALGLQQLWRLGLVVLWHVGSSCTRD